MRRPVERSLFCVRTLNPITILRAGPTKVVSAMNSLEQLIRFESAHSRLAFRREIYRPDQDAEAIIDCLALANVDVSARCYLFLGVDDSRPGDRVLVGVDERELGSFKRRFLALIAESVEPALAVAVRAVAVDDRVIGYIRIKDCVSPPYLARRSFGEKLQTGAGFIRRGTTNHPLQRSDLQRMFGSASGSAPQATQRAASDIRIGFLAREPGERLTVAALPLNKLPSQIAAERLKSLLVARDQTRDAFGRTETQLARLTHARLFGMDVPFEKHSDSSLVTALGSIDADYRVADEHYLYEVRAHKLNLMLVNDTPTHLHQVVVRLSMPRIPGTGVAERIYTESEQEPPPEGYPRVTIGPRTVQIEAEIGTVYGERNVRVLREPLRFWARDEAIGKTIPVDYEIRADELDKPVMGNLAISVDRGELKSV